MSSRLKKKSLETVLSCFLLMIALTLGASAAWADDATSSAGAGNSSVDDSLPMNDPGSVRMYKYFPRYPAAAAFGPACPENPNGHDVVENRCSKGPGTVCHSTSGPVYAWPVCIPTCTSSVPSLRDTAICSNMLRTYGMPISDTQFQMIQRYNQQILIEQIFDPERLMWVGACMGSTQVQDCSNSFANCIRNQCASAIDFVGCSIHNFTCDDNNKWNKIRNQLFLPMAILLLLPGAVLAQLRVIVAAGMPIGGGDVSPFEGITRSIVAIFLIPATYLVVNYGIDLNNSITYTIANEYQRIFGSNMYKDALCTVVRAFPVRQAHENLNGYYKKSVPWQQHGNLGANQKTPASNLEAHTLAVKYEDPCAGINSAPADRADEMAPFVSVGQRFISNASNVALSTAWNILCAFQLVFFCYLWLVGPIVAALWVYPSQQLRGALPSWVEGVITLSFWGFFWNVVVLLFACFKGVDDTGSIITSALIFLATAAVKYAFDFAGLIKDAGHAAAGHAMGAAKQMSQGAGPGGSQSGMGSHGGHGYGGGGFGGGGSGGGYRPGIGNDGFVNPGQAVGPGVGSFGAASPGLASTGVAASAGAPTGLANFSTGGAGGGSVGGSNYGDRSASAGDSSRSVNPDLSSAMPPSVASALQGSNNTNDANLNNAAAHMPPLSAFGSTAHMNTSGNVYGTVLGASGSGAGQAGLNANLNYNLSEFSQTNLAHAGQNLALNGMSHTERLSQIMNQAQRDVSLANMNSTDLQANAQRNALLQQLQNELYNNDGNGNGQLSAQGAAALNGLAADHGLNGLAAGQSLAGFNCANAGNSVMQSISGPSGASAAAIQNAQQFTNTAQQLTAEAQAGLINPDRLSQYQQQMNQYAQTAQQLAQSGPQAGALMDASGVRATIAEAQQQLQNVGYGVQPQNSSYYTAPPVLDASSTAYANQYGNYTQPSDNYAQANQAQPNYGTPGQAASQFNQPGQQYAADRSYQLPANQQPAPGWNQAQPEPQYLAGQEYAQGQQPQYIDPSQAQPQQQGPQIYGALPYYPGNRQTPQQYQQARQAPQQPQRPQPPQQRPQQAQSRQVPLSAPVDGVAKRMSDALRFIKKPTSKTQKRTNEPPTPPPPTV